ncbi:MAG TPA: Rid family hydrolase [Methylibium sp.]|uniref:chorismate transformation enzyme, FkbO/Hyg5 family n=1 Tax=Methylibium sp. TaxID=2067992 RepID=UPI002DB6AC46|nr:Rid family hydrolase [Methylibium sp.]HEU4458418.1 Rid family hydrolase [Methylibium sp.]
MNAPTHAEATSASPLTAAAPAGSQRAPDLAPRLRSRRVDAAAWAEAVAGGLAGEWAGALGAVGCAAQREALAAHGLPACTLLGAPQVDVWWTDAPARAGRTGRVRWRSDGRLMFGTLHVEPTAGDSLEAATHAAYTELFAALDAARLPALLRVWNYLPRINDETPVAGNAAIERYRQFNVGRQRAFLEAGAAAFEGAPAACALGTHAGPMCISFLAGARPALAIENPRQLSAYRYPQRYGPKSPSFSRAALLDAGGGEAALLVSGTSSIVGHETLHAGDVAAQTRETLANLRAVIAAAHAAGSARFALADLHCTIYLRHAEEAPAVRALFEAEVGTHSEAARAVTLVEADICRADLRVEIEAHGFAAGGVGE